MVRALIVWVAGVLPVWAEGGAQAAPDVPAASSALPSSLPVRRDTAPVWETGGIGVLGALSVVLVVAGALAWGLRRGMATSPKTADWSSVLRGRWLLLGGKSPSGRPQEELRMVRSLRLTPRASVHVVEWNGRQWLVGASEQAVSLLGERSSPCTGSDPVPSENGSEGSLP